MTNDATATCNITAVISVKIEGRIIQVSHTLYTTDYKPLDYDLAIVLFSPQRREGAEALSLFEFIEHCHKTLRGRESRSTHTLCIDLGRVRRGWRTETSFMCFGLKLAAKPLRSLAKSKPVQRFDFIRALPKVSGQALTNKQTGSKSSRLCASAFKEI